MDKSMSHVEALYTEVKKYLDSQNWVYGEESLGGCQTAIVPFPIQNGLQVCFALVTVSDTEIQCFTHLQCEVPEAHRAKVGEYLHRAQHGQKVGKFEFNYDTGNILFQSCHSCIDGIPSQLDIERVVDVGLFNMKRYGAGLFELMNGRGSPVELIEEAEREERKSK